MEEALRFSVESSYLLSPKTRLALRTSFGPGSACLALEGMAPQDDVRRRIHNAQRQQT
jgi:hypothetical protein